MTRLPRFLRAFGLAAAILGLPASWAAAQAAPADPAAPPAPPAPTDPATPAAPPAPPADPAAPAAPPAPPADPAAPAAPPAAPTDPAAPAAPPAAPTDPAAPPTPPTTPPTDPSVTPPTTPGTTTPPTDPSVTPGPAPAKTVDNNIENLLHALLTGQYALAVPEMKQLAGREATVELLQTVEKQFRERDIDSPDLFLYRFRDRPELKESIDAVIAKLNEVRTKVVREKPVIDKNIDGLLATTPRAQAEARTRLMQAGEMAVPEMVRRLGDPNRKDQHGAILGVLREMRGSAMSPLLAATEMRDEHVLIEVCRILVDMGAQPEVLPFIIRVLEDPKTSPAARTRITADLAVRGIDAKQFKAGDLFYQLAERFYYNTASLRPDVRDQQARVWVYNQDLGLSPRDVPKDVFADVMAIRCAELALRYNTTQDAVGLWLSANNKRVVELKEQPPGGMYADLDAHYWNVRLGVQHLNQVLVRAMRDGDARGLLSSNQRSVHTLIALRAIKSLGEIVGQSNMGNSPLLEAMRYSDRQVRYEAALALAGGLPQKAFGGQERVVLLLAEALAQTGTSGVLIFANTPADVNAAAAALKDKFRTAGGTNAAQVIGESAALPSIDAILISEDVNSEELRRLFAAAASSPRLDRAARVIMVKSRASDWVRAATADTRLNATTATPAAAAELAKAIEDGKARAGGIPLSAEDATKYAMRAAEVLNKLAISRGQVLDILPAEPTMIAALADTREELAKASAGVVSLLDSPRTQAALCDRAIDEKTPDPVKVAMYKGLATSAKFYGNRLDAPRIETLRKAASNEKTPEVRAAAAEGLGALNLNVEQVKPLILDRPGATATPTAAAP